MEAELMASVTQFGVAGLVAWMWLSERRASADRERQLTELTERLTQERREMDTLLGVIDANTRALVGVEAGQRELIGVLDGLSRQVRSLETESVRGGDAA